MGLALTIAHGPEPKVLNDVTSLPVPVCPQGSLEALESQPLLRLRQCEALGALTTQGIRAQSHAWRKTEGKGKTHHSWSWCRKSPLAWRSGFAPW